jgi:3-dehydroquinate synthase
MKGDEFDTGRRNLLNFGHDFGHALESTSNFEVPHGQAVIFGMMAANRIALRRGLLPAELAAEIDETLLIPSLVVRPSASALEPNAVIAAMKQDKKRIGDMLALIMMDGHFNLLRVNDVTQVEVEGTLAELAALCVGKNG